MTVEQAGQDRPQDSASQQVPDAPVEAGAAIDAPSQVIAPAQHEAPAKDPVAKDPMDRIWTIPNVLSFFRLIGVPFFLWLIIINRDVAAVILLAAASLTDLIDGRIARAFNQKTHLGEVLDPLADRLYTAATLIGLTVRGIVPLWFLIAVAARDLFLATLLPALKRRGYSQLPVNFIGKAATFCLLIALPAILLGAGPWGFALPVRIAGWAFAFWGVFLYWWSALIYFRQTRELVKNMPVERS